MEAAEYNLAMKSLKSAALLVVALCVTVSAQASTVSPYLQKVAERTGYGAQAADDQEAYRAASSDFDGRKKGTFLSTPLVTKPPKGTLKRPTADLVVGDPKKGEIKEPPNPLTKDNKLKPQKSGKRLWWAGGGAALGAGVGFLVGGPIGALVGGILGAVAGFFFGP